MRKEGRGIISTHLLKHRSETFENNLRPFQIVKSANFIALQKEVKSFTKHLQCDNLHEVQFRILYFAKKLKILKQNLIA